MSGSQPGSRHGNKLLSYDIEKECDFSFYMIYFLCYFALSIQSYADLKKLKYLIYTKSLNRENTS